MTLLDKAILIKVRDILYKIAPKIPNPIIQVKNNFKSVNQKNKFNIFNLLNISSHISTNIFDIKKKIIYL